VVQPEHALPPRYRQPERIARGGMGVIYRAEDTVLERLVAVKVLADPYADDASIRRRFTHEALAAARLSNAPGTTTIFDVGEHEGRPYIVMEYLPGGSLADRLAAEGAQPPGRALAWLAQAAGALDSAHAAGIVHRDVKPANLLLDDHGHVKVADFGVASAVGLDSFTAAGTIVGTAGYLSPEQARGDTVTPASDRYALAVVAFELLTGKRPFERDTATAEAAAHVSAPVPAASWDNPELPPEVDDVLARGLEKRPEDRFDSCSDFVAHLRAAFDAAAGHTAVHETAVAASPARRGGPPRGLAVAGALLLALAGAALAFAFLDGDGGGGQEAQPTREAPQTVQETVTLEGTTVVETVVTTAPPPEEEPPATTEEPAPPPEDARSPAELNDEGFALMQAEDYESALPLLEQAVAGLAGSGELVEAYASYNLAFTRRALGRCDGILELLDRSEEIQGRRGEIQRLRKETERSCGGGEGDG
jgi:tRNA A-37 threonylcarbamoyl transferase component Bud32